MFFLSIPKTIKCFVLSGLTTQIIPPRQDMVKVKGCLKGVVLEIIFFLKTDLDVFIDLDDLIFGTF